MGKYKSLLVEYSVLIIVNFMILSCYLHMDQLNLKIPMLYSGDALPVLSFFKQIFIGEFSFFGVPQSHNLSAPFMHSFGDYPMPMLADWLIIKFISIFTNDYFFGFNLFVLLSFFANPMAMYYVLRKLRIGILLAIAISMLYNVLPFHFYRIGHTFYINYFFLPLLTYYLMMMLNKKPLFFKYDHIQKKLFFDFSKKNIIIMLVLLFSSTWNYYYTFYFCIFVGFFTLIGYFIYRKRYYVYSGVIVLLLSIIPFTINMLPYKTFTKINGVNPQVAQRGFAESEVLALKIAQLLLPINTHKIGALRDIRARYDQSAPLVNENHFATLGIIGSIGFILLLLMLLNVNNKRSIQNRLAMLNIIAVLYATIGGLSVLFALMISPSIRGHNRISIFIATFSLIAVALFLQYLFKKYQLSKVSSFFAAMFIMLIGLYDQIPGGVTLKTNSLIELTFNSDKRFIQQIEYKLKLHSSNNMIMQYPHMSYPEQPVLVKMHNYSHMIGYLHSNNIHWSYGAVTGREGDVWLKSLEALDIEAQIKVLQKGGFTGIYIDRRGYIDNANMLESKLKEILNIEPIISEDKNKLFFEIVPTDHTIMKFSGFEKNFYGWESNQFGSFGWTSGSAILLLQNNRANNLNCNISFNVGTLKNRNLKIMFNDKLLRDFSLQPGLNMTVLLEELRLNPGSNRLSFITDTPGVQPGNGDPRSLAYSIEKMKIICGGISVGNLIE